jgi:hypothetical protein
MHHINGHEDRLVDVMSTLDDAYHEQPALG